MTVLGERLRLERQSHKMSLEALAERSGVSRSMLSAIERGTKVPTVLVLDRIANALSVSVSRLLEEQREGLVITLPAHAQKQLVEPGWTRSILSPVLPGVELELARLEFEPQVDAGEFAPHQPGWTEYVAVEDGTLEIVLNGSDVHVLNAGDSIYYASDLTHAFRNAGDKPLVAYILMINYSA
jgi:transcriptional regulator with XRE-family HTH domain